MMIEHDRALLGINANLDRETEEALREALARFEALRRSSQALVMSDNLGAVLQAIVDITAEALEAHQVTLFTFDLIKREVELMVRGGSGAKAVISIGDSVNEPPDLWAVDAWRPGRSLSEPVVSSWPGEPSESTPWTTITAPLIYSERILGIIKVANPPSRSPFTKADDEMLVSLANQAALAVESYRLRTEERAQRKQADTLREVARILNYSLDQQRVLELILDQLARVVEYDSASIMLLSGDQFSIVAHRKFHMPEQLNLNPQLSAYGHIHEVIERRRPVIIDDTQHDPRWQNYPHTSYIACWLGVPLIGRNQVIGLLNLDKETTHFYTQQDATLASTFANQAAIAIENARLYSAERQRVDQLNSLRAIATDISAELELPRLLQSILQRAVSMLSATGGDLGLYDENTKEVHIFVSYNMGHDYSGTRMVMGEGAMGLAIQTRRPVLVDDYMHWENASPQYHGNNYHGVIATPFLIGRRIVGAIGIVDTDPKRRFTPSDQHFLSLLAQHAAIAVENARLFLSARQATDRRNTLHQVSQDIVAVGPDSEAIYQAIHRAAQRLMPAEAFVITRLVDDTDQVEAVYLVDRSGRVPSVSFSKDQGLTGEVLRLGHSILIPDITENEEIFQATTHFGDPEEISSLLAVPMRLRGKVVGIVSAQSYATDAYNDDDMYLLEMLASYAAVALENIGLFQNVQQLAITDPLIDIFNRRHLFELGEREFLRARRFGRPLAVLMIDIDTFKLVNDSYSHDVGDKVLQRLGQVLKEHVREIDIIGRYGGEELVVVLPEADLWSAREVAERLRVEIQKAFIDCPLPEITVSIGVASILEDMLDFSALVHQADLAMYQAKQAGRNRVEVALNKPSLNGS